VRVVTVAMKANGRRVVKGWWGRYKEMVESGSVSISSTIMMVWKVMMSMSMSMSKVKSVW
jgi:hypothetical protein